MSMRCVLTMVAGGIVASLAIGCGDSHSGAVDAAIDALHDAPGPDADPTASLAGTGLCLDPACSQISPDVHEFVPQFPLYADGATKRRWIYLPPGSQIDTPDMNHWKQFTAMDGTRIETRYITKLAADETATSWFYISYEWNAAQNATTPVTQGQMNANGTTHDIPSRGQCKQCHESLLPGRILGFQAVQLDYAAPAGMLDLDGLVAAGLLSAPPAGATSPHFPLPGTQLDKDAMGYLHANCGHCHNPSSPVHNITPMVLRLDTTKLGSVAMTPTYTTTHNVTGITVNDGGNTYSIIVKPGDSAHSIMHVRMSSATMGIHMPLQFIGAKVTDAAGVAKVAAWIDSLN